MNSAMPLETGTHTIVRNTTRGMVPVAIKKPRLPKREVDLSLQWPMMGFDIAWIIVPKNKARPTMYDDSNLGP